MRYTRMNPLIEELNKMTVKQRTPEWYAARSNFIGASECASLLNRGYGPNSRRQLISNKLGLSVTEQNIAMKFGTVFESLAKTVVESHIGKPIHEVGLLVDGYLGGSPDGIYQLDDNTFRLVEIKCPLFRKSVGYPRDYYCYQMAQCYHLFKKKINLSPLSLFADIKLIPAYVTKPTIDHYTCEGFVGDWESLSGDEVWFLGAGHCMKVENSYISCFDNETINFDTDAMNNLAELIIRNKDIPCEKVIELLDKMIH